MGRRRLRLHCSSDGEDQQQQQQQQQSQVPISLVTPSPIPNPNPNPTTVPFEISDDDFMDVPESFSPPSPNPPAQSFQPTSFSANSPVYECLLKLGLKLRIEWLNSCISGLASSVPGFASLDVPGKAKLCFEQFLVSDMNSSGGGLLPQNVHALHLVDLPGPFVLQVDEIVNLSHPLRNRYQNAPAGIKRCLKLSMTDGVQRVFGMEYRPIKALEVLAPAGLKVIVRNVHIRRGLLILVPEVLEVLGGSVGDLDAARQRLVTEINKPPRGKRTRAGVVPSLASRATLAAWPSISANDHGHSNRSMAHSTTVLQSADQAATFGTSGIHTRAEFPVPNVRPNAEFNSSRNAGSNASLNAECIPPQNADSNPPWNVEPHPPTSAIASEEEINIYNAGRGMPRDNKEGIAEVFESPRAMPNAEDNQFFDVASDAMHIDMVDELEHPILLTGDKETPFTYLASLFAKLVSEGDNIQYVQGKIKCLLTGVKGFQFKNRATFDLQVYVDDGSLISEVVIDHSVVQKRISFSPEEVTAALSSSDISIVSEMKEKMKSFQIFLANFEGTMLVKINKLSCTPVALEMNPGYSTLDAWLLLRRLKSSMSPQAPLDHHSEPIELSP